MARENGRQISRDRKDVSSVPTRKDSIPNFPDTGSQVLVKKKERPKALSEGMEWRKRLNNMAANKTTIARPDRRRIFRKTNSARMPGTRGTGAIWLPIDLHAIVRDRFDDLLRLPYGFWGKGCIV